MSTLTSRFKLKKPAATDPVAELDELLRETLDRIDYCYGESGDNTITPSAANTKTTKVIAFGRTYDTPPRVVVSLGRDAYVANISAGAVALWVDDVTTTDFTVGVNAGNTTAREFTWMARPKNTDNTV